MKYLKKFNENTFEFSPEDLANDIDQKETTSPENKHHTRPNEGDDHQNVSDDIEIKANTTPENKHHTLPNEGDDDQNISFAAEEVEDGMKVPTENELPKKDILYKENIITKFINFN